MNFAVTVLLVALVQYSTAESTNLPSTTSSAVESSATTTVVPSDTTKVPELITSTELPLSSSSNPSSTAEALPAISTERTPDSTTAASTNKDISSPIPSSSTDSVPNTAVTENTTPTSPSPSTTPEEQDEPGTLEIVYHLIRHGINFECFEKLNGDEVGRKVQDGLNVCLQGGKNFGDELKRQEMERHLAAIREIEESTFGLSTMLQMAAENMRHARILAGILVQANIEGVKNTVACVTKTLSDAHQNLGVNADSVVCSQFEYLENLLRPIFFSAHAFTRVKVSTGAAITKCNNNTLLGLPTRFFVVIYNNIYTITPEEQDKPGTLEIVYHLIRHGINFECFEKLNGDEVGRKVQDGLNVCLQGGKNFGDELKRQEMERHLAAIREIEESTFGLSTMLQMAAENMRHARILAGILVQANIEGVKNTVACVSKTLSDAHQNLGVNADSVRKCLVQ